MIRLLLLLAAVLFLSFLLLGEDRGQLRYGLQSVDPDDALQSAEAVSSPEPATPSEPETAEVYVPALTTAQPVADVPDEIVDAAVTEAVTEAVTQAVSEAVAEGVSEALTEAPTTAEAAPAADTPAAPDTGAAVLYVAADSVNVREGPGKDFTALDRLSSGEAVALVSEQDGWSFVRIEGDGLEGWIRSDLLTTTP